MRAIIHERYGPPDALVYGELPTPVPGPGTALVRVRAAAIFFGDHRIIRGRPFVVRFATGLRRPKNPVPGIDVAGVVESVGSGVADLRPGDEVFGWAPGTLAEYACAPASQFVAKPASLSFEAAAAAPEAGMTALQGLRDAGRVRDGQHVLVIGASGGVGTFAVQIAKALGATVTAVCSTRNLDLMRSIGADDAIDYTQTDLRDRPQRYDVIYQGAGTDSPHRLRHLLTPTGTLVLSNGAGRFAGIDRIITAMVLGPFVRQRLVAYVTRESRADLLALRDLLDTGAVRPVIDRRYPLERAPEALAYLEAGHTQGKVVITV